jgi:hypothetical protein
MHPQLRSIFSRPTGTAGRRRTGGLLAAATIAAALLPGVAVAGGPEPTIPTISVQDYKTGEPNKGFTSTSQVTVSLSSFRPDATVGYQLIAGTAIAGKDFVAATGTVSFASGGSQTIPVTIKGDNRDELNETFRIKLLNPVNATIADGKGVITILDNDGPVLVVKPPVKVERGPDQHPKIVFKLVLTKPGVETIKVTVKPVAGALQPGVEVTLPAARTFTFLPGQTSKTYAISTTGDYKVEGDEDVSIALSDYVNTGGAALVTGTIKDDDCTGSDPGADDAFIITAVSGDDGPVTRTINETVACHNETDWYRVVVTENLTGLGDATQLRARVRLTVGENPPQGGGDLDLCLYRKTILDADTLVGCSTNTGTADEVVTFSRVDNPLVTDTTILWARIQHHGVTQGPNDYTITVTGDPA